MGKYRREAEKETKRIAKALRDQIVEDVIRGDGKSNRSDLNDYPEWEHYDPLNQELSDRQAKALIEDLQEYEESDAEDLSTTAHWTYRNAVHARFSQLIGYLNGWISVGNIPFDINEWINFGRGGKGVLDWDPSYALFQDFPAAKQKRLEQQYAVGLRKLLGRVIDAGIKRF